MWTCRRSGSPPRPPSAGSRRRGPHHARDPLHHLVHGQAGGVELQGAGRHLARGECSAACVLGVPERLVARHRSPRPRRAPPRAAGPARPARRSGRSSRRRRAPRRCRCPGPRPPSRRPPAAHAACARARPARAGWWPRAMPPRSPRGRGSPRSRPPRWRSPRALRASDLEPLRLLGGRAAVAEGHEAHRAIHRPRSRGR